MQAAKNCTLSTRGESIMQYRPTTPASTAIMNRVSALRRSLLAVWIPIAWRAD